MGAEQPASQLESCSCLPPPTTSKPSQHPPRSPRATSRMSEAHFDEFEHYNFDQDKAMRSGHSGKQRTKKEASMNTNKHNPGGHERKIVTKLMNAEKNNMNRVVPPVGGGSSKN